MIYGSGIRAAISPHGYHHSLVSAKIVQTLAPYGVEYNYTTMTNGYTLSQLQSLETEYFNKLERAYTCTRLCDTGKCRCPAEESWETLYSWMGIVRELSDEILRMNAEGEEFTANHALLTMLGAM